MPADPGTPRRVLTLHEFLTLTAAVPAPELRRAIVAAAAEVRPSSPEAYRRFYCRVIVQLGMANGTGCDDPSRQPIPAAA